jgi:hypothetical protein
MGELDPGYCEPSGNLGSLTQDRFDGQSKSLSQNNDLDWIFLRRLGVNFLME